MSEQTEGRGPKPDGSAYAAHLAGINERNAASKKEGKAQRERFEQGKVRQRLESEKLLNSAIQGKH